MNSFQAIMAIVSGVLGIILTFLKILEIIKPDKVLPSIKKLLSDPKVAWWLLVIVLLGISLYLILLSWNVFPRATFPVEAASVTAFPYEGGQGWANLAVTISPDDETVKTRYVFSYGIPEQGEGYAGLNLQFADPQDLSEFNFVELKISFEDDQAQCNFCIDDSFGRYNCVILGGNGGIVSAAGRGPQAVSLQLSEFFSAISLSFVSELTFDATLSPKGDHAFTISEIQFRR